MKLADFFYTSEEAAKILGVTHVTIWRWVKSDKLNAQYIGREAFIPKWEIELLKENTKKHSKG
jgi:excisionase family DNA binding protein